MLRDYLSVMFFFLWTDLKNWFARKWERLSDMFFIHVWHRRHVFNLNLHVGNDQMDQRCLFCPKTLWQVSNQPRPNWRALIIVLILSVAARADDFLGGKADSLFYKDSAYTIAVVLTSTNCAEVTCQLRFADGVGPGAIFNVKGGPKDTVRVKYDFNPLQFAPDAKSASIQFYGGNAQMGMKLTALWGVRLAYKDPKPTGLQSRARRAVAPSWPLSGRYSVNGRVFR